MFHRTSVLSEGGTAMKRFLPLSVLVILCALVVCPIAPAKGLMLQYKGIGLGNTKEDVHQKLGKPKSDSDGTEEYDMGDSNTMDITYADNKAVTIVLYFYSNDDKVPKFEDVVGDASIDKKDNGSQTAKLVDAKSKTSITMFQMTGANPMTVITLKQL